MVSRGKLQTGTAASSLRRQGIEGNRPVAGPLDLMPAQQNSLKGSSGGAGMWERANLATVEGGTAMGGKEKGQDRQDRMRQGQPSRPPAHKKVRVDGPWA